MYRGSSVFENFFEPCFFDEGAKKGGPSNVMPKAQKRLPAKRGPYLPYTRAHVDWSSLISRIEELKPSLGPHAISFVSEESNAEYKTLWRRYHLWAKSGKSQASDDMDVDEKKELPGCGDLRGRKNASIFSCGGTRFG